MIPMRPLSTAILLSVWENGVGLNSLGRAQVILDAAREVPADPDPREMPLGEVDSRLLTLREWTFGNEVIAVTRCPKCKEELELTLRTSDLRSPMSNPSGELSFSDEDYRITFHLPTSADLAALSNVDCSKEALRRELLARCVSEARRDGEQVATETLPDSLVDTLSERMSEMDPQAEIELNFQCGSCGEHWNELFNVESFFWTEIQAWAVRLLNDVHQLATSYGWSESEILAMSLARRTAYLSLITG